MRLVGLAMVLLLAPTLSGCFGGPTESEGPGARDSPDPLPPFSPNAAVGDTRLFARVGEPGRPEGIALDGDRLYISSASDVRADGVLFVYNASTGNLSHELSLPGPPQQRGVAPGATGLALDAAGRLYVAELGGARIVRLDPAAPDGAETYAEIPNLPPCSEAPLGPCAPTAGPRVPLPNYPAFGPDGALYVSDSFQHTLFRIPAGGGQAEVWYQEPRFQGFGMNGIALSPDDSHLYIAQSTLVLVEAPNGMAAAAPAGAIWRLPFREGNTPADLESVHVYPGGIPDGIAFGASGRLYVTIIDAQGRGHGISVLDANGSEEVFFPAGDQNSGLEVPFDGPASLTFHDERRSILVTNQAAGTPDHWAILESFVNDVGLPLHRPDVP